MSYFGKNAVQLLNQQSLYIAGYTILCLRLARNEQKLKTFRLPMHLQELVEKKTFLNVFFW